jgi:hypothetical protein
VHPVRLPFPRILRFTALVHPVRQNKKWADGPLRMLSPCLPPQPVGGVLDLGHHIRQFFWRSPPVINELINNTMTYNSLHQKPKSPMKGPNPDYSVPETAQVFGSGVRNPLNLLHVAKDIKALEVPSEGALLSLKEGVRSVEGADHNSITSEPSTIEGLSRLMSSWTKLGVGVQIFFPTSPAKNFANGLMSSPTLADSSAVI